jgi:phenylacetate-CoA ligase
MNVRITRAQVEEFIADPARIGHRYLDHYAVWTTSGITGRQGIFVHDDGAQVMYTAMLIARTSRHMRFLLRDGRVAVLVVPGGHFAVTSLIEALRRCYPLVANAIRPFSALSPLPELVGELNAFRPTSLIGYPTLIQLLAKATGRLTIEPELVTTEDEWLSPVARAQSDRVDVLHYST